MEKKEKESNPKQNNVLNDNKTEFVTDIERNLPTKSFYSKQASDDGNIALGLFNDMKRNSVNGSSSTSVNDNIIDVVALGILPSRIQRKLIVIDANLSQTIPPIIAEDWLAFFKY